MNLEKEEDHHHHHHRENVSENISIGREEKRGRDTRASFAIEKGLVRRTTTTTHESSKIARERKFSNSSHNKEERRFPQQNAKWCKDERAHHLAPAAAFAPIG